jgi:hypothetical protein
MGVGVAGASAGGIFLSYRRDDAGGYSLLLKSEITRQFPRARLFVDLDSIEPGLDFTAVIDEAVRSCSVLLALIGPRWTTLQGADGRRRLDDPGDWVCAEVTAALRLGKHVVPVLVGGARPPLEGELPSRIRALAKLQALELSSQRFDYDTGLLVKLIGKALGVPPAAAAGHKAGAVPPASDAVRYGPSRAPRVLIDARTLAHAIGTAEETWDGGKPTWNNPLAEQVIRKSVALTEIWCALATLNPGRAVHFTREAQRMAEQTTAHRKYCDRLIATALAGTDVQEAVRLATGRDHQDFVLRHIAIRVAIADPDRAESIAESITARGEQLAALAGIARRVAASDQNRAAWLTSEVDQIGQSGPIPGELVAAFTELVKAVAVIDPERAERLAARLPANDTYHRQQALTHLARTWAASNLMRAVTLARSARMYWDQAEALAVVASAVLTSRPDEAEKLISEAERLLSFPDAVGSDVMFGSLMAALAAADPERSQTYLPYVLTTTRKVTALVNLALAEIDLDLPKREWRGKHGPGTPEGAAGPTPSSP